MGWVDGLDGVAAVQCIAKLTVTPVRFRGCQWIPRACSTNASPSARSMPGSIWTSASWKRSSSRERWSQLSTIATLSVNACTSLRLHRACTISISCADAWLFVCPLCLFLDRFCQTQPLRLGRWHCGRSQGERQAHLAATSTVAIHCRVSAAALRRTHRVGCLGCIVSVLCLALLCLFVMRFLPACSSWCACRATTFRSTA